ncbi:ORF6N domain-containing protein [Mucilaginibacter daejeonensis]|nr:ORF6N domain-containing protein [Mucilaginibacter daejeonensis]
MLDIDPKEMYRTIPKRSREQVKRNVERFSPHFTFQLTDEEAYFMVSQNATPSRKYIFWGTQLKTIPLIDLNISYLRASAICFP